MKQLKQTYIRSAKIMGIALLALLALGSFADLPISKWLYPGRESSFGQFFAAFGEMPAFLQMSACGAMLFRIRTRLAKKWNWLILAGCFTLVFGGIAFTVFEATDNVPAMPAGVAILVSTLCTIVTCFVFLVLTKDCSVKTTLRFMCVILFVTCGSMILVNVVKIPWGRVRMRLIASTGNESYFTPWWQAGTALKKKLMASGVDSVEFRSFPSGHTASATCTVLAILYPTVMKRLRGREWPCFLMGTVWGIIVGISRIMMGAHYLSDVIIGSLLTYILAIVGVWLFYFNKTVFDWFWLGVTTEKNEKIRVKEKSIR